MSPVINNVPAGTAAKCYQGTAQSHQETLLIRPLCLGSSIIDLTLGSLKALSDLRHTIQCIKTHLLQFEGYQNYQDGK